MGFPMEELKGRLEELKGKNKEPHGQNKEVRSAIQLPHDSQGLNHQS